MNELSTIVSSFLERYPVNSCFMACSGGVDSMVLLDLLLKTGKKVNVLHVNYGLRGEASNADELLVREVCAERGLSLSILKVNLYEELKLSGGNLQQRARERRYAFFDDQVRPEDGLFMGHHLDDQFETFFLALSRGGGIRSLACMPEKKGIYCRPLLSVTKESLLTYAKENNISWREDVSNNELRYSRNKWRNLFLPLIEKSFPKLKTEISFMIACFQEKLNLIQSRASELRLVFEESQAIPFQWFKAEEGEVVAELLRMLSFSHGLNDELFKLLRADKGARLELKHHHFQTVYREKDHFYFSIDAELGLPKVVAEIVDFLPERFDKWIIYLDPDKLVGNLKLRYWKKADRIKSIGINGSKLISDVLSDAKVPSFSKAKQLVLHDDVKILWCIGYAVSREAIATSDSHKIKVSLN
jgi:tRNA(Ile)-lysidine synthase